MALLDHLFNPFGYYKIDPLCPAQLAVEKINTQELSEKGVKMSDKLNEATQKIVNQNDLIFQLQKSDDGRAKKIIEQQDQIFILNENIKTQQMTIADKDGAIESLKTELAMTGEPQVPAPEFLDQTKPPYMPFVQFSTPNGTIEGVPLKDARDIYSLHRSIKDMVLKKGWHKLSKFEKTMVVWGVAITCAGYKSDFGDNWQFIVATLARVFGDCDDTTVVFVSLCWVLGLDPREVWTSVGPTSFGYHAYPIVKLNKEDILGTPCEEDGEGYYIYESTLDFMPDKPRKLIGSGYNNDAGLANWKFAGVVRPAFAKEFNTLPSGPAGAQRRIEHGKEKRKRINDDWKRWNIKETHP